ncbi:MAG: phosphate ABC transporter substrate-binding protein [Anaerolineae bacterium]|jgi:phosphate transport system substrate-binding protein
MRRSIRTVVAALATVAVVATACGSTSTPAAEPQAPAPTAADAPATAAPAQSGSDLSGEINVAGSTTVQPLAEQLAAAFMATRPDVRVAVQGGGSSTGVKSAGEATVDIGMASREVKESELAEFPGLQIHVVARDGIAVVANPGVPVDNLTPEQVREIFAGNITNWSEVAGPDEEIVVVAREEGSGTRAAFEEMIMGEDALITDTAVLQPSNGAIRSTVASTPNSIGFLSFGYLDETTKALSVDGVAPSAETAADGSYPIVRPLNMLTSGDASPLVQAYLDFALSEEGQAIVAEEGYLTVK